MALSGWAATSKITKPSLVKIAEAVGVVVVEEIEAVAAATEENLPEEGIKIALGVSTQCSAVGLQQLRNLWLIAIASQLTS